MSLPKSCESSTGLVFVLLAVVAHVTMATYENVEGQLYPSDTWSKNSRLRDVFVHVISIQMKL